MLDAVSSALSGFSAVTRRFDAVANNSFNEETRGAGGPSPSGPATGGSPASGAPGGPPPEDPRAVEETGSPGRGSAASLRSTTPSYLSALDPSVDASEEDSDSAAVTTDVDAAEDDETNPDGSGSAALEIQARSEADQQAIRVTNELVRRLYDLG